jgi:hypothetical protein
MRIDMRNKVLCNNGTYSITTGAEAPCSSAGGVKQQSFDWAEVSKNILKIQGFPDTSNVTSTPVLCKDGTTKIQKESPNAEYMDACVNNGGRAEKQPVVKQLQSKEEVAKRVEEEIAKIKFPLKTTLITSAVPLGLAYYSYYNNYSLTKGIGVVVIGSVVALYGTIILSGKGKFV